MLRLLITVFVAASVGSLAATVVGCLLYGGTGALSPFRLISGIILISMVFTIPGVLMLIGLQARLADQRVLVRDALLVMIGMLTGAAALSFIGGSETAVAGSWYGAASSLALLIVQRLDLYRTRSM